MNIKSTTLGKLNAILKRNERKGIYILCFLLLIGALFEMGSIAILIPGLTLIVKSNPEEQFPVLLKLYSIVGTPTKIQLISISLFFIILIYGLKPMYWVFLAKKQNFFTSKLYARISHELFEGYLRKPYSFYLINNSAELLRNIQQEVQQFAGVCQAVISLGLELIVIFGVAGGLFILEPLGTLVLLVFFVFIGYLFHATTRNKILSLGEKRQSISSIANQTLLEGFGSIKDIKIFDSEQYFIKKFKTKIVDYSNIHANINTLGQIPRLLLELASVIAFSVLLMVMLLKGKPLEDSFPIIMIFLAAAFRLIPSINRIIVSMQQIKFAEPVINVLHREFEIIKSDLIQKKNNISSSKSVDLIDFNGMNFSYGFDSEKNQNRILKDITFTVNHKDIIGIVGSSGAGKTTLLNILLGLLKSNSGTIIFNEEVFKNHKGILKTLFGYVPQSIYLMDSTIASNIAFGINEKEINKKRVEEVIKMSQLNDFIDSLPEGINTYVGESGVRLSGGQKQRIGMARALYNDPPILVLDEATSALDNETEIELMKSVLKLKNDKTIIIVAHRLSTLKYCNKIYEIMEGKLHLK